MKPRALIRVFNLLMTFDSTKSDSEVEKEALLLIEKINRILADKMPGPLPQIELEDSKKKVKIGVKPYKAKDLEE